MRVVNWIHEVLSLLLVVVLLDWAVREFSDSVEIKFSKCSFVILISWSNGSFISDIFEVLDGLLHRELLLLCQSEICDGNKLRSAKNSNSLCKRPSRTSKISEIKEPLDQLIRMTKEHLLNLISTESENSRTAQSRRTTTSRRDSTSWIQLTTLMSTANLKHNNRILLKQHYKEDSKQEEWAHTKSTRLLWASR
jgi:hypothetical protein